MSSPEGLPRRGVRSFVRREGRLTTGQARALAELLPHYAIPCPANSEPRTWFDNPNPVFLEIGTGNGENLFLCAQRHPEANHVAVEVHGPGIGQLLLQVARAGLRNVRVGTRDVLDVLAHLPGECLQEIGIFFPDPWPKKRHHKRRLITPEFLASLHRVLARSGCVRIATDVDAYAEAVLECLATTSGWKNLAGSGQRAPRPRQRCVTRFERRALQAGRTVHDFLLARAD